MRLLKRLDYDESDEKQWLPRQAMWYINSRKDEGLRPHHPKLAATGGTDRRRCIRPYQEAKDRAGLVDLPSYRCAPHELWPNKPHILQHYRERFTNIPWTNSVIPTTFSTPVSSAGGRHRQGDDRWRR